MVSSCAKMDDLYKGTGEQESTLFEEDVTLPSAFNWESSKAVDVRIAVDDNYSGKYFYRVELYDGDPKSASSNLLGAGVAKSGQDYVDKIMVPTALTYVYVKQTSPVGIAAVSMIEVANKNTVSANKSAAAGRANNLFATTLASSTTSGSGSTMMMTTASTPSVTVPADAIKLIGNNTYSAVSNQAYVVETGTTFTGRIDLNNDTKGAKVYVQGTWNRSSPSSEETNIGAKDNVGNAIIVDHGGILNFDKLTQNSEGFFENYGTVAITNLKVSDGALYKNYGTLEVTEATVDNGSFSNYGTTTIQTWTSSSPSTIVRNEGSLTIETGDITNGILEVACYTTFGNLKTNGLKVSIAEGALLHIGTLESSGTQFDLASLSILNVSEKVKFINETNKVIGQGSNLGLARLKKVEIGEWDWIKVEYSGNLQVASSEHVVNQQYFFHYSITSPAAMVAYDQSTVVIAATECNAGGNNDAGAGTDPDDQTTPEVSLGAYSYAFEDNWPSFGDYDMNDFVVDMDITKFQNTDNQVTKVQLKAKLRSVGAAKRLAAAVQLDGVAANNVKGVTYSNSSIVGTSFNLSSNGTESGQTYAVVPITSDAHQAFGQSDVAFISTKDGQVAPVELTITAEFNTPLANFTYENLNVFIVNFMQNKGGRNEVHLAGYKATDKINSSLVQAEVNSGLLSSVNQPFKSKKGYPWAISVPVSFDYPDEWKNISGVYPNFKNWAKSGGVEYQEWYIK